MNSKNMIIAIDGTAGSGKSTIAKKVAERLNIVLFNTGKLYRSLTCYFLENKIKVEDVCEKVLSSINVEVTLAGIEMKVLINKKDYSDKIRIPEVNDNVGLYSALPKVRQKVLSAQRDIKFDAVVEGRDIGSVVFPQTKFKFFITADLDVRAQRRMLDKNDNSAKQDFEEIRKSIALRDYEDVNREISPLIKTDDAVLIDSSKLNVEQTVQKVLEEIRRKM